MRIIDNRKDYYDCMQSTDTDKTTLWIRQSATVHYTEKTWPLPSIPMRYRGTEPDIAQSIIGFCGKLYPWLFVFPGDKTSICRKDTDVDDIVRTHYGERDQLMYFRERWHHSNMRHATDIERFFEDCKARESSFMKLFEEHRTPVFVAQYGFNPSIEFNAILKPLEFFRAFPPAQAYQDIVSFMSNMAVPMKPIPKLDDKTMAAVKGFDRFSFRKDPTRKKR